MKVLVVAASRCGATAEIARRIADVIAGRGYEVICLSPEQVTTVTDYDAVVIGSAVYTGHWLPAARDMARRCGEELASRPVWLFSSGPVGTPNGRLARQMWVDPAEVGEIRTHTSAIGHRMFAGKLDRTKLPAMQRASLLVFRGLEGDFRDWRQIDEWAAEIADALRALEARNATGAAAEGA